MNIFKCYEATRFRYYTAISVRYTYATICSNVFPKNYFVLGRCKKTNRRMVCITNDYLQRI